MSSNLTASAIYLAKSLNYNDLATMDQTNYQIHYQQNQLGLAHAKRQTSGQWSIQTFFFKSQQVGLEHVKSVHLALNLHSTQSFTVAAPRFA